MVVMTIRLEEFMVNEPMVSLRTWHIQSALMMSLPYVVRNITMPVLPLQITLTPLSLALILVSLFRMVGWDSKSGSKLRRAFCVVGACSSAAFLAVEIYAIIRGNGYLTSETAVALNQALSVVELLSASLALTWWCLSAPKAADIRSGNHATISLGIGFTSPLLVQLVADALKAFYPPSSIVLCLSSGAIAYVIASISSRWEKGSIQPVGVISGLITYQIAQSFAPGVNAYYGFYSGAASPLWYCLPLILLALVLLIIHFPKEASEAADETKIPDRQETAIPILEGSSASQLSDRERAIVACSALGYSQKDIASMLGIAASTVSTYRVRAFKKLEVDNLTELQHLLRDGSADLSLSQSVKMIPDKTSPEHPVERPKLFPIVIYTVISAICILFSIIGVPFQPILPDGTVIYQASHIIVWTFAMIVLIYSVHIQDKHGSQAPRQCYAEQTSKPIPLIAAGISLLWGFQIGQIPPGGIAGLLSVLAVSFIPIIICAASHPTVTSIRDVGGLCRLRMRDRISTIILIYRIEMLQLFGAGLVLAKALAPYPPLWTIKPTLVGLIAIANAWWYATISRSWQDRCTDMETGDDQLLKFLKEHGMGELQALVILDCINGASIKETCARRHTTENTVKSYRKRAYRKFGVSCASELKETLRRELETTKGCTLHP